MSFLEATSLSPGESLRLEMFENNLSEPPLGVQTFSPSMEVPSVYLGTRELVAGLSGSDPSEHAQRHS